MDLSRAAAEVHIIQQRESVVGADGIEHELAGVEERSDAPGKGSAGAGSVAVDVNGERAASRAEAAGS